MAKLLDTHLSKVGPFGRDVLKIELDVALEVLRNYRESEGFKRTTKPVLLTAPDGNAKLEKSKLRAAYGLSLSPASLSGDWNACKYSTSGCRALCHGEHVGNNRYDSAKLGKVWKTKALGGHPREFFRVLHAEIQAAVRKHGEISCRLNVYSDVDFGKHVEWMFSDFGPSVSFYDYTKDENKTIPAGYTVALSMSERFTKQGKSVGQMLDHWDGPVAVVIRRADQMPTAVEGFKREGIRAVSGNESDEWMLGGKRVGLLPAKGHKAITDTSGFVRDYGVPA